MADVAVAPSVVRDEWLGPSPSSDRFVDAKGWANRPVAPWRRYLARTLDTAINATVGFFLLGIGLFAFAPLSAARFFQMFDGTGGELISVMLSVAIAVPVNAIAIGITGSSIGKALFGVRVVDPDLRPIGVVRALGRELYVWGVGLAFGLPILSLIFLVSSHSRLTKTGFTYWDAPRGLLVLHRPVGGLQYVLSTIGVGLIIALVVLNRQMG